MGPFLTIFASFIALFALCYEVLGVKFESMNEKMIDMFIFYPIASFYNSFGMSTVELQTPEFFD